MKLKVLIPTFNKTIDEIVDLFSFWNLSTDCIVSNQCGYNDIVHKIFNGHNIKIICSNTIGVSINRNILMKNLDSDIGIFIDDDCSMIDDYQNIIIKEFEKSNADYILFNGYNDKGSLINKSKKTIKCRKYKHVSHTGGPGIAFTKNSLQYKIAFNEKLGTPNKIYMGEDSFFAYQLIKKKTNIIKSTLPVFKIINDIFNSSYFNGYTEQYFYSKGAINKLVHPHSFKIWKFYYSFILKRKTKNKFGFIIRNMIKGEKSIKKGEVVYLQ